MAANRPGRLGIAATLDITTDLTARRKGLEQQVAERQSDVAAKESAVVALTTCDPAATTKWSSREQFVNSVEVPRSGRGLSRWSHDGSGDSDDRDDSYGFRADAGAMGWTSSWMARTSILTRRRETAAPSGMARSSLGLWTLLELRRRSRVSTVSFHMPRGPPA